MVQAWVLELWLCLYTGTLRDCSAQALCYGGKSRTQWRQLPAGAAPLWGLYENKKNPRFLLCCGLAISPHAALEVWSPLLPSSQGAGRVCVTLNPSKCLTFSRSIQAHGSVTNMCCGSVWNVCFIDKDNTTCNGNSVLRAFVMLNRNFVERRNTNSHSHGDSEKKISFFVCCGI